MNHAFDVGIQQVDIVEVQIDRIGTDPRSGEAAVEAQNVTRDFRGNALTRLNEFGDRVSFSTGRYRIGHIIIRIHFGDGRSRASRVTVKIKPPWYVSTEAERAGSVSRYSVSVPITVSPAG